MVIGRRKIARGRPSGASSRDGGASSRRAAAGFPAISNNLLMERVEQHTVGVSEPRVRSTTSVGASLALGATASRYGGASSRRAAADSQRFSTIFRRSASINIRWACVGRGYGPRPRRAPLWPRRHGVALGPKPLRLGATGTELQRAAGQRRPCEPLGRGVTAGGPPGAHTSQDLACPRLILKRGQCPHFSSTPGQHVDKIGPGCVQTLSSFAQLGRP